jgi:hypothetical protein
MGTRKTTPRCRHCRQCQPNRARGLCWRCHRDPAVRALYPPSAARQARRSRPDQCGGYALPGQPTDAVPGSEEKIRVLAERAAQGVCLWHPLDATRGYRPAD